MDLKERICPARGEPYSYYADTGPGEFCERCAPYGAAKPETGWLIERKGKWYAAAPHSDWDLRDALHDLRGENWTTDASRALRFARQQDAETLIRFVGWQHATATKHAFIATGSPDGR